MSSLNRNKRIEMGEQGCAKWRCLLQINLQRAQKAGSDFRDISLTLDIFVQWRYSVQDGSNPVGLDQYCDYNQAIITNTARNIQIK